MNRRENNYIEYAVSLLENIHIVNESIVSSVNDMVTEIAIQFVAENFEEFTMRSKIADVSGSDSLPYKAKPGPRNLNRNGTIDA